MILPWPRFVPLSSGSHISRSNQLRCTCRGYVSDMSSLPIWAWTSLFSVPVLNSWSGIQFKPNLSFLLKVYQQRKCFQFVPSKDFLKTNMSCALIRTSRARLDVILYSWQSLNWCVCAMNFICFWFIWQVVLEIMQIHAVFTSFNSICSCFIVENNFAIHFWMRAWIA